MEVIKILLPLHQQRQTDMKIQELKSTGKYNMKAVEKYFAKQVKAAMVYGANEIQAMEQAGAMLRIYSHNLLIREVV